MKSVLYIYNPSAGKNKSTTHLDKIIESFQDQGYRVDVYRSSRFGDMRCFFDTFDPTGCEAIIASGGDGSINHVVNGMMYNNIDVPLAIIPSGTANDFAYYLNMPSELDDILEVFSHWEIETIDVGKANNQYFINVCGSGLFTKSSLDFNPKLKNTLGKLAYYLTGIGQIPKFKPYPLRITTPTMRIEDDFYFFLALNGISAGGFKQIAKYSSANDGLIDFVGIKAAGIEKVPKIFLKVLQGEHFNDPNVLYFQEKEFSVECLSNDKEFKSCDLDGEQGPDLPLFVKMHENKLKVFSNRSANKKHPKVIEEEA